MKKLITLFCCLTCLFSIFAQNKPIKVAVAISMDTVFTVLGPYGVKTFDVNLSKDLFGYICEMLDRNAFELHREVLPDYMVNDRNEYVGFPAKSMLLQWLSGLRKKKDYDLLLFLFRPQIDHTAYSIFNGFSYGMTVSENRVFSLNDAYVLDARDAKPLAHVNLNSKSDYITRLDSTDQFRKSLRQYTLEDIAIAKDLVVGLNKNFALMVCQNLILAKKKFAI